MNEVKKIAKELCEKSPCHHKCHDTKDCIVEDEALLLINQNKSNEELFKQALVEGVNRHIDKTIEQAKQIEEMRAILCRSGAINHCEYCEDCEGIVEALYNAGYRKQSVGEWVSNCQTDELICSLCGAIAPVDCEKERFYKSNFCPNCGSKMKGANNEN